jgi:hypothetical protein
MVSSSLWRIWGGVPHLPCGVERPARADTALVSRDEFVVSTSSICTSPGDKMRLITERQIALAQGIEDEELDKPPTYSKLSSSSFRFSCSAIPARQMRLRFVSIGSSFASRDTLSFETVKKPGPEGPKHIPRILINVNKVSLEAKDDPIETNLNLISLS